MYMYMYMSVYVYVYTYIYIYIYMYSFRGVRGVAPETEGHSFLRRRFGLRKNEQTLNPKP